MRLILVTLLALLLVVAAAETNPNSGSDSPSSALVEAVQAGDAGAGVDLRLAMVTVGYLDVNGNGAVDAAVPDEPMYLDLDNDHAVSYGDLRLTRFLNYPIGTSVDYTNRDFGRLLQRPAGWFARDAEGHWYVDSDGLGIVTPGDLRLSGNQPAGKVHVGDADLGRLLETSQSLLSPSSRIGWLDTNNDFRTDLDETLYVDVNGDQEVSSGDLRIVRAALAVDNDPTRGEFDSLSEETAARDQSLSSQISQTQHQVDMWATGLLLLGLVNLAGLGFLMWYVFHRLHPPVPRRGGSPQAGMGGEAQRPM